ncbi:MAG: MarR family winged helix-turn-helix transcriptional regulator [Acidimicrobiales bacterium]
MVAAGIDDLGRAQVGMFRYPTPEGRWPSEIADRLEVTKQSVNDLLGDMERRGYLLRVPDATDRRASVVPVTAGGRRLAETVDHAAEAAERAIAYRLGPRHASPSCGAHGRRW